MPRLMSNFGVLIAFFAILTGVYLSVIQNYFLYMDDYFYVFWDKFGDQVRGGRFLNSFFLHEIFNYIRSSPTIESGVRVIRFTGIIAITLLAYVTFSIFKTCRFKTEHAFLISVLICTLPPIQVDISWVQGVPWLYGAVLAALSALVLFKAIYKESSGRKIHTVISFVSAVILLVSALCLYQPAAMVFWSMAVIPLARLRNEDLTGKWRTPFISSFSVGFGSLGVYFLIVKIVHAILYGHTDAGARGALIDASRLKGKIQWFLNVPLKNSLNLWDITPTYTLAAIVVIIILAGLILGLRQAILLTAKERNFTLLWNQFQRLVLIGSILPLSLLPTLMVVESWATYRTVIALEMTVCILLFISLLNIGEFFASRTQLSSNLKKSLISAALILLTVFAAFHAHGNVKNNLVRIGAFELKYIRNAIQDYGVSNISKASALYIRCIDKDYYLLDNSPFEFGQLSSSGVLEGNLVVDFVLYELGIKDKIKIIQGAAADPLPEDSDILVVDLMKMKTYLRDKLDNNVTIPDEM